MPHTVPYTVCWGFHGATHHLLLFHSHFQSRNPPPLHPVSTLNVLIPSISIAFSKESKVIFVVLKNIRLSCSGLEIPDHKKEGRKKKGGGGGGKSLTEKIVFSPVC